MAPSSRSPGTSTSGPRGWHSRGYLPHFDAGDEFTQFVTFRLADSVPGHRLCGGWQDELLVRPDAEREAELHRLIEAFLDTGYGACHLRDPRVGDLVEDALLFFDAERYSLPRLGRDAESRSCTLHSVAGWSLSEVLGSWKSFTAKKANKLLGRTGQFWQEDYFDRYIRDEHHFHRAVEYIELNPVKAGLCDEAG